MKILTVDFHPLICDGLAKLVTELGPDVEVTQADCVGAALAQLASNADFALILLELMLSDEEGVDTLERVRAACPEVPVVVFSASTNDLATVRALIGAGARGVLSDRCPPRVLVEALRLVLVGGVYVPPEAFSTERAPAPAPTHASPAARPMPYRMCGLTAAPTRGIRVGARRVSVTN